MKCFFCPGVFHPATGAYYSPRVVACGPCTRELLAFTKRQMARFRCTKPRKLPPADRAQPVLTAR